MTHLSTGVFSPNLNVNPDGFVPFVIYAKFNAPAGYGKRMEKINEIEKNLNILEGILTNYEYNGAYGSAGDNWQIEFSKPIKYAMQFGNKPTEFIVNGNSKVVPKSLIAKQPTSEIYVDADEKKLGYGATNNGNRVVNSAVDSQAALLWNHMQGLSTIWTLTALSYNGVMYGNRGFNRGGRTIN